MNKTQLFESILSAAILRQQEDERHHQHPSPEWKRPSAVVDNDEKHTDKEILDFYREMWSANPDNDERFVKRMVTDALQISRSRLDTALEAKA
jgi:hypothetical protein